MDKLKVAYVLMQFPVPSEVFVSNDIAELKRKDVDVTVFSLKGLHRHHSTLVKERGLAETAMYAVSPSAIARGLLQMILHLELAVYLFFVVARNAGRDFKNSIKCFALFPSAFYIWDLVVKEKMDVVHLYWGHFPSLVGFLIKRSHPNVVVTISLSAYDLVMALGISKEMSLIADRVFTWAEKNIRAIKAWGIRDSKITLIYQSLHLSSIPRNLNTSENASSFVVCSAGRLIKEKSFDDVLRAFSMISQEFPCAQLVLAGDGPERQRLENLSDELNISKKVIFLGHIGHHALLEKLKEASAFIFLSSYKGERLPNVVKEAMACGCICVATATEGMDELIQDGKNGFLVGYHDYKRAASIIIEFFRDRRNFTNIRLQARKTIDEHFDIEKSMQGMVDIWTNLIERDART